MNTNKTYIKGNLILKKKMVLKDEAYLKETQEFFLKKVKNTEMKFLAKVYHNKTRKYLEHA